ncbi:helix-turn-helix domain-containing protein [Bifidobacterium felsineum]|uniref:helix-turn-helix domain-containing protein n=1 Tax=Bifidobacterium felsineum TaxID=2045440 RepID=UPI001BDC828C|nr:AraC family transcriptional regulator [Bifidobacterium felsineum]MBT1163469.1 AraC family transcriptional regulator [Bifidobacterium felsineum]
MMSGKEQGSLEIIVSECDEAIRWSEHGYPSMLARWHHHPEIEIHLIREGSGFMMAGDAMVPFHEGQVFMLGPNLPHNWISNLDAGQTLAERDVLCQVHPNRLNALIRVFPEASRLYGLLRRSERAIALDGQSAAKAARLLEKMGRCVGFDKLIVLLNLLQVFADAPTDEWSCVVTPGYDCNVASNSERRINTVLSYIEEHLSEDVSLQTVAREISMSGPAFSRFFKQSAGVSFSDMVRRLRVAKACRLLDSTNYGISRIQAECGYVNTANFNRRFRQETGMTPSEYRRRHR